MRPRKTFQLLALLVAILLMSVGYAAIQDIDLVVTGNIAATPDQANFKVKFFGNPTYTGTGYASLKITGDTTATMDVSGLQIVGDYVTGIFTVFNSSEDLTANLSCLATHNDKTHYKITTTLSSTTLQAQTATTLHVKVELIEVMTELQSDNLNIVLIASPSHSTSYDNIIDDGALTTLISFTIAGIEYQAEEGMTWAEWCESSYDTNKKFNSSGCTVSGAAVCYESDGNQVEENSVIKNGDVFYIDTSMFEDQ